MPRAALLLVTATLLLAAIPNAGAVTTTGAACAFEAEPMRIFCVVMSVTDEDPVCSGTGADWRCVVPFTLLMSPNKNGCWEYTFGETVGGYACSSGGRAVRTTVNLTHYPTVVDPILPARSYSVCVLTDDQAVCTTWWHPPVVLPLHVA